MILRSEFVSALHPQTCICVIKAMESKLPSAETEEKMTIILTETASSGGIGLASLIYLAVIFTFFYFVMIRPQKKEQKRMSAMLAALEIGDSVLTNSGFYGIVIDIADDTVIVEFGNNKNCRIPMQKSAISQIEKPGEE